MGDLGGQISVMNPLSSGLLPTRQEASVTNNATRNDFIQDTEKPHQIWEPNPVTRVGIAA